MQRISVVLLTVVCLAGTIGIAGLAGCSDRPADKQYLRDAEMFIVDKDDLQDKIKGGWAGQIIGCTYGGPTEFLWNGTMIDGHVPIPWDDDQILWWYENFPGLYDDVYVELTFMETIDKYGVDAADSLYAAALAHSRYPLWHANQAARYNILNGIMPPASGNWKNNPHADDIDFQIEADFAGLMSPGMVNSAADIAWRTGHIMNSGDGVYGGVYVAAMHALAFVYNDVEQIVNEALKAIPPESQFYKCIADIIRWHAQYPGDWRTTWFEAQKKWTSDKDCPDGVFKPFNIDAKINAAYIVIGLLYGQGDFGKTTDISTRCGYDSDCNPSNAAGILGTMLGYSRIPDYWKKGLEKVSYMNFSDTDMSFNKVYEMGFRHACGMIVRNGGIVEGDNCRVYYQSPKTVPFESNFTGLTPVERKKLNRFITANEPEISFVINGSGFVVTGYASKDKQPDDAVLEIDVIIDGQLHETVRKPTASNLRRTDVAWYYELPEGRHAINLKVRDVPAGYYVYAGDVVIYSANQ